jgi:hypothetical protein
VLAVELARAGDEVHVWAPGPLVADRGVTTHALRGRFGPRALAELWRGLAEFPAPRRLLVQYVPQAFGYRGMNLPFCAWFAARRTDERWVMFHEFAVSMRRTQPLRRNVLGAVTTVMGVMMARAADRGFVSIPSWEQAIRKFFPSAPPMTWLPIPSNIPVGATAGARARLRAALGLEGRPVIGHFGTYGAGVAGLLAPLLEEVLRRDGGRRALLLGRGAEAFARRLSRELHGRVVSCADLPAEKVADHLTACDVLVQPYPDGISTRRTSAMAGLALGIPIASNLGALSEPLWASANIVELAPEPTKIAERVDDLLRDRNHATRMAERGLAHYAREFSIEQTRRVLRGEATADRDRPTQAARMRSLSRC